MSLFRGEFKSWISYALIVGVGLCFTLIPIANAQNASVYISPSTGRAVVGETFSLAVRVNTGGVAINAIEGSIVFDPQKLEVVSLSRAGSIFGIWASEPNYSNPEGVIEFAGGLPTPGYSGANGLILTIIFKAKSATTSRGYTEIVLVSGAVLANDGEGTNILSSLGKATYYIGPAGAQVQEPEGTINAPVIKSSTHTDQQKWYPNNSPTFSWNLPTQVDEVSLVLSRRSNSPPIISYDPPISEKTLTDLEDGTWYLNARFKSEIELSSVTSFRFNIDTVSPGNFTLVRVDEDDSTNPRPELLFESSDETSGIDRYEMRIGGNTVSIKPDSAGRAYAIPVQKYGTYNIEIKAIDKAGNYSSSEIAVEIDPIKAPVIAEFTEEAIKGNPVAVKGTAEPGNKIIIEVDEKPTNYSAVANDQGLWSLEVTGLTPGRYNVNVRAQDERLALSEPSNFVKIKVRGGFTEFLYRLLDWIVNTLSRGGLLIAFLIVLAGLILAIIEIIRSREWWSRVREKMALNKDKKKTSHQLDSIIEDIEQEIKFLRQIGKRRKLGTEENYLKSKLNQYLKTLKGLRGE